MKLGEKPLISQRKLTVYRLSKDFRAVSKSYKGRTFPGFGQKIGNVIDEAKANWMRVWASAFAGRSRYSNGKFPVLYTATRRSTCYSEVGFHVQNDIKLGNVPGEIRAIPHILYRMRVKGKAANYVNMDAEPLMLCAERPAGYIYCNKLAHTARNNMIDFLIVPSARARGTRCVPVLAQAASSPPIDAWPVTMLVTSDLSAVGIDTGGTLSRHRVYRDTVTAM